MTPESRLLAEIRLALSNGDTRLFRNNNAQGWVGKVVAQNAYTITLSDYRPLHAGLADGSGDLIGWTIRNGIAVFTSVEAKSRTGRMTPQQTAWLTAVRAAGGIAGIARTVEEAVGLLKS